MAGGDAIHDSIFSFPPMCRVHAPISFRKRLAPQGAQTGWSSIVNLPRVVLHDTVDGFPVRTAKCSRNIMFESANDIIKGQSETRTSSMNNIVKVARPSTMLGHVDRVLFALEVVSPWPAITMMILRGIVVSCRDFGLGINDHDGN